MNRFPGFLMFALLAAVLAGCSGGNSRTSAKVSGRLTYKGAPIKGGSIHFITSENTSYPGRIDTDGTYTANDLPPGEMVVTVDTESLKPKVATGGMADKYMKMQASQNKAFEGKTSPAAENTANYVKIPTKYNNAKTSTKTITLKSGRQVIDIDLED